MQGRRRLGALAVVAMLSAAWLIGATPGLAGTVSNTTGSNSTAQVAWGTSDDAGAGRYGGLFGDIESAGTMVGLWENDAIAVTCDGGTPADPSDDWQGLAGTMRNGWGDGMVTIAPNLARASVSGVLTIETTVYNMCAGDYVTTVETDVPMALELVAVTKAESSVSRVHELLANQYNFHQNMHTQARYAAGTAFLGGAPYAFDSGLISHNHWTDHMKVH